MSTPKSQLPLAGSERAPLEGAREIGRDRFELSRQPSVNRFASATGW
jgi:hypothetical protein